MSRILVVADAPEAPDLAAALEREHGMDATVTTGRDAAPGSADCLVYDDATAGIDLGSLLANDDDVPVVVLRSLDAVRRREGADDVATRIGAALPTGRSSSTSSRDPPSGRAAGAFRSAAVEDLTDKQRTALRTAHLSGFFEWPRVSTGEEVAATLGVSPATFHQHLRVGQGKLMDALFDE